MKHHLYGFLSGKRYFSVGNWLKLVTVKINNCHKKRKVPIIVGGTGLYFNSITKGISKIPNIDIRTRAKVRKLFKRLGFKKFYNELTILDPKAKGKLLPTDSQRIQRVYEVFIKTNKSFFDWIQNTKSNFIDFDVRKIYLDTPRDELLKKIYLRTELMFKSGCVDEVKNFNKLKLNSSLSINKLIGIQEINKYLSGHISMSQCKELILIKTRQYAKRQNTWARGHMKNWNKVYSKDFAFLLKKTLKLVS